MTKTELRFFTIADFEEEELWLREQHKKGLRFVRLIPPCIYIFEECSPQDVIYCLDCKNDRQNEDYLQLFRDYGWDYLGSYVGWVYFRKNADEIQQENDGKIFSDKEPKADMIKHIILSRMIPLFFILLLCLIPSYTFILYDSPSWVNYFSLILLTPVTIFYIYILVHCGRKLQKLKKNISE